MTHFSELEVAQPALLDPASPALDHQRPDGVLGEWNLIPEEDWNIHQRIAEKTGGWATAANLISVVGAAATIKGGMEFARGNKGKALAYVGVGRLLDLADGIVAKKLGTRSETGALVDAGIDKALTVGAAIELAATETIDPVYAGATILQQGRIVKVNNDIKNAGGEPNPSKSGKHGMFAAWTGVGLRIIEDVVRPRSPRAAKVIGAVATGVEVTHIGLAEDAIQGYRTQKKSLLASKA